VKSQHALHVRLIEFMALFISPVVSVSAASHIPYDAAVYSAGPAFASQQRLILFPLSSAKARSIPLPFPLGIFAIGSDGKAIYAERGLEGPGTIPGAGIFKIEFDATRVGLVPGSTGFRSIYGFAVSSKQDKILVSGTYWDGARLSCGVFQLRVADGSVNQVLIAPGCDRGNARTYLSFSSDGTLAAAIYRRSLELIDLARNTTTSVGNGFYKADWSPNGKWIAALEHSKRQRTVLFDATTLKEGRILETSDLHWSPDSRYLLAWKWQATCGPEIYSLETIDVQTGKTSLVESSECKLVGGGTGWVSDGLAQ